MSASNSSDRWAQGIDFLRRANDYAHIPLLEAARDGLLDLVCCLNRKEALPFGKIRNSKQPVLTLICDDDDSSTGPVGWSCAHQVTQWACGAIVHGAGAKTQHYQWAVQSALITRRFLMVDTSSQFVPAWMAILSHVQALAIVPREGEHPAAPLGSVH